MYIPIGGQKNIQSLKSLVENSLEITNHIQVPKV